MGRGAAIALAQAGFEVFATGRSIASADLPPAINRIACDHLDDAQTRAAFERLRAHGHGLDVLVNSAWGGYERMLENGQYTWTLPFWEQPLHRWTSMLDAGVRAAEAGWFDLANSESPEFIGRVVAALWNDPALLDRSGQALVVAAVASELRVTDLDGKQPEPLTLDLV